MKTYVLSALLIFSTTASAGECKSQLESLLVSDTDESSPEVLALCQAESESGDAEATYHLSFFYFGTVGTEVDKRRGVELVREAAEKGYALAQYWMGWQSEIGQHLEKDDVAAVDWYQKAAESENWMALDRLERAYRNGELGLDVDKVRALEFSRNR